MFGNEMQNRYAIGGTGILLGLVLLLTRLPLLLLIVPVTVLFLGLVADQEETHAVWYGILNTLGLFDLSVIMDAERPNYAEKRHYFWFGEVSMATMVAGVFAVPLGFFLTGRAGAGPCRGPGNRSSGDRDDYGNGGLKPPLSLVIPCRRYLESGSMDLGTGFARVRR